MDREEFWQEVPIIKRIFLFLRAYQFNSIVPLMDNNCDDASAKIELFF